MLKQLLFKPFPADFSLKRISVHAWSAFGIVFFILFFLQPFRISELNTAEALLTAFSYAMVCPIVIYCVEIACVKLLPRIYDEKNWYVLKHIAHVLLIIVCIAMGNVVVSHVLYDVPFTLYAVFAFLKYVLAIGVFPTVFGVIFSQYQYQKKYNQLALAINKKLENNEDITPAPLAKASLVEAFISSETDAPAIVERPLALPENIKLIGQNNNEYLEVKPAAILYLEAADNYVAVLYLEQNKVKKVLLRSTLALLGQQLQDYSDFIKCHRSYIINKHYIIASSGNAQGLKLQLQGTEALIPVSRTLTKLFSGGS
jgi:LytTr DNA-binding domain